MLTVDLIRALAPHARADLAEALASDDSWQTLHTYEIASNLWRLAGFLANVCEETGGLTVFRESLNYPSPARLRAVWPSRFRSLSDAQLMGFVHNEMALAREVYNGRMGNRPGTDDGYIFRGWGYLMETGRSNILKHCAALNVNPEEDPAIFDDLSIAFEVACAEWAQTGCNQLMDAGNFDGTCATINVGDARRVNAVIGIDQRRLWLGRAKAVLAKAPVLDEPATASAEYGITEPDAETHWTESLDTAA